MSRKRFIYGAVGAVVVVVLAAFAYNSNQSSRMAAGVSVGGVDISGLTQDEATQKLKGEIQNVVQSPLVVIHRGQRRTLLPKKSKVGVNIEQLTDSALERSNSGFFLVNAVRRVTGSKREVRVPVEITYSKPAVKRFVGSVGRSFDRGPQDASLTFTAGGIGIKNAQRGEAVRGDKLTKLIVQRLENPTESRRIRAPMRKTKAQVTTRAELAKKYPTVLVVDRAGFKLRLYRNLKLSKTYPISVGKAGVETPTGLYSIQNKQVDPTWTVPNSDWAGDLAGKVIPPGPDNPLIARWLGIYDGVGIHGTNELGSLGTAASHGCIRMNPSDVIALYPMVPVGAPVYIA